MPVVSVLMPFHRVTPHLWPAVQSILGQTLDRLELILVDNGTGAGLAPLEADGRDPRIRLVSLPENAGIAAGRNAAFAQSRGEFIALLDYDDIALPARLAKQVSLLRAEPSLGLVSCLADRIDGQGTVTGREFALLGEREQKVFSNYSMPAPAPSFTGRRELFERFPFRPELDLADDYDFVSRVAEVCAIRAVPETLLHYRHHDRQATQTRVADQCFGASVVRLLTARRRSGRAENFAQLRAALSSWFAAPPPRAVSYAHFARLCLQEKFPLLAVYHARRLLSVQRDPGAIAAALGIASRALRLAPRESGLLARMFFTGPLRTHGLRPA